MSEPEQYPMLTLGQAEVLALVVNTSPGRKVDLGWGIGRMTLARTEGNEWAYDAVIEAREGDQT